jgi:hypothetical protein
VAVYQSDPNAADDSGFEPGSLAHLVVGNSARLLDPRRTPLEVVGVVAETGLTRLRVQAFEDAGAVWELPVERVDRLQFRLGSARLDDSAVTQLAAAVARFDRTQTLPRDAARLPDTLDEIARQTARARLLVAGLLPPLPVDDEHTSPALAAAAALWWEQEDVASLEAEFARAWASNPGGDETVKAHLLVFAGLGLVDYRGPVLRDPARLAGVESVAWRERHVLARLGFVRAMFAEAGVAALMLYRGYALTDDWDPARFGSLLSTTADRAVAESHFAAPTPSGVLQRATIPVERVFMTWLETPQLSRPYRESEVTLLAAAGGSALF